MTKTHRKRRAESTDSENSSVESNVTPDELQNINLQPVVKLIRLSRQSIQDATRNNQGKFIKKFMICTYYWKKNVSNNVRLILH